MDGNNDMYIIVGNLHIKPYEIQSLLEIKIEQKMNEHGTFYFKGVLPDGSGEYYAETSTKGTPITLTATDNNEREYTLFQGLVNNLEIHASQGVYYIEVHAVSYSFLMDIARKSRSFQDKNMPYANLIRQVTANYPNAAVIDTVPTDNPTNKLIIQHLETDWGFLKRMASHFNTGLICDVHFAGAKYFFGVPEIETLSLDNINYTIRKDMQRFQLLSQNGVDGLNEEDFIYYEIETRNIVNIGDCVQFNGRTLYVYSITSHVNKGVFTNLCVLSSKKAFSQNRREHLEAVGMSFGGNVIDVQNDRVKVHLDIDQEQDVATAYLLPYSTLYSTNDGSGWYFMPAIGDRVRVYCPDGEDDHAYAISSVHEPVEQGTGAQAMSNRSGQGEGSVDIASLTSGYSGMRDDPSVKSLVANGKEIRITEEGIYIITEKSVIALTDEDGIILMSEDDISFKSNKSIYFGAEEGIQMVAGESIIMNRGDSASIVIHEDIEVKGQEVKLN